MTNSAIPPRDPGGKIEEILIAGGGTAGWMSALYLKRALGDSVRITLVESPAIGSIGVGEATFNTIKGFFDYLGLEEDVWMPLCDATYKMAIRFVDWNSEQRPFYHPFQRSPTVRGVDLAEWWLKLGGTRPFDASCFNAPDLCEAWRSPMHPDGRPFYEGVTQPYGYHFDAGKLAHMFQELGTVRGVRHIQAEIGAVSVTGDGAIAGIRLNTGETLSADLYLDCTGNTGLLINKTLGVPFVSFGDSLLCDTAVVFRDERDPSLGVAPYTQATAMSSGWLWEIPLLSRISWGYVFSSRFLGSDDASLEMSRRIGIPFTGDDVSLVRMRIGRSDKSWVRNCVSVGLSCGFVEPLESTGLFFIQHQLAELLNHFPGRAFDLATIDSYNRVVAECIDGVRDFLVLHYYASNRTDTPFWRATKEEVVVPEDLLRRLRLWTERLPNASNVNPNYHGFAAYSYVVMLLGLGYRPRRHLPLLDHLPDEDARVALDSVQVRTAELLESLPPHHEYTGRNFGSTRIRVG